VQIWGLLHVAETCLGVAGIRSGQHQRSSSTTFRPAESRWSRKSGESGLCSWCGHRICADVAAERRLSAECRSAARTGHVQRHQCTE